MRIFSRCALVGLLLAGLTSCQKYEEGPSISFRSAEKRVFGGYHITEYTVDGVDSLSLYNDSLCLNVDFYYNDVAAVNACAISGNRKDGAGCNLYWHWHLSDDGLDLVVDDAPGLSIGTGPFGKGRICTWRILRLKAKEIKMKTTYSNKEYMVKMVDDY
jgi:hypothetical protein